MSFIILRQVVLIFFFFNDTATTEIYTLSLHDALPISGCHIEDQTFPPKSGPRRRCVSIKDMVGKLKAAMRSEEHTSELQSHLNLVCRLLLEKKKKQGGQIFAT